MAKKSIDMLNGSIVDKLLLFALPIAASSILQQLFNSADLIVVGRFVGSTALAAVGANSFVTSLIVGLFVGLSLGSNAVISNALGRRDEKTVFEAIHTSVLLAIIAGIALAIAGQFAARPIMTAMSTPPDVIDQAVTYFRIYFLGMPFFMLYNFSAAILRSRGDTRRPLVVLTLAGIANVFLNLFFVIVCKLGVAGVAIATSLSNAISSICLIVMLTKEDGAFKLDLRKLHINFKVLGRICMIGVPAGVQGMLFGISNTIIQTFVNQLGSDVVAAASAALSYETFVCFIFQALGQAAISFIAQNHGAGNYKRCRQISYRVMLINLIVIAIGSALVSIFARVCMNLFSKDPAVIDLAVQRIRYIMWFEILNAYVDIFSSILRGYGNSIAPMFICVIGICGVRLGYMYTYFQSHKTYPDLLRAYPLSWVVAFAALLVTYFLYMKKIKKEELAAKQNIE